MKESLILVYGDSMCLPNIEDRVAVDEVYAELLADYQAARGLKARVYVLAEGDRTMKDRRTRYVDDHRYLSQF